MKPRRILVIVAIIFLLSAGLPASALTSSPIEAPGWVHLFTDWLQGSVESVLGLLTDSPHDEPTDDPAPSLPIDDSGVDQSTQDPGSESTPEIDPNG